MNFMTGSIFGDICITLTVATTCFCVGCLFLAIYKYIVK